MVFDPGLNLGETITNKRITEIFGGNPQYGMSRSLKNNTLVLRSKPDSTYNDRWVDEDHTEYLYTGMGLEGDQDLDYSQNRTLNQSRSNGVYVFLFMGAGDTLFTYMGRVILNGEPFQEEQEDENGLMRKVWMFPLKLIDSPKVKIDLGTEDDLENIEVEPEETASEESIEKRATTEEPPIKDKEVPPKIPTFKGIKTDFHKKNRKKKLIGDKGELFVIEYEENKLRKLGRDDLAVQIKHVSKTQGDGTGYDIKSFNENGAEILIEVKTTVGPRSKPFNISWVEIERSKVDSSKYFLYRVFNFNPQKMTGTIYILKGSLEENFSCYPVDYKAYREIY
jgi:5-methylcytosine-specific restriction protein A